MIDWTKPIETVPCERNPKPVPCNVLNGPNADGEYYISIKGLWIDADGEDDGWGVWSCRPSGVFNALIGSVRNVVPVEGIADPLAGTPIQLLPDAGPVTHHVTEVATLRDQFALAALPAVLAEIYRMAAIEGPVKEGVASPVAAFAYELADAMMAERNKQ